MVFIFLAYFILISLLRYCIRNLFYAPFHPFCITCFWCFCHCSQPCHCCSLTDSEWSPKCVTHKIHSTPCSQHKPFIPCLGAFLVMLKCDTLGDMLSAYNLEVRGN